MTKQEFIDKWFAPHSTELKSEMLSDLESLDNWIPVSEPPKESGRYWCLVKEINDLGTSFYQWNCYYNKTLNQWFEDLVSHGVNVTHWQPLPKAPTK